MISNLTKRATALIFGLLYTSIVLAESPPMLTLELNTIQTNKNDCKLTFVIESGVETKINKVAYEFAFFDAEGSVDRISVLNFKDFQAKKTKVKRFTIPKISCENISRILINENTACLQGETKLPYCMDRLHLKNRTKIEFLK